MCFFNDILLAILKPPTNKLVFISSTSSNFYFYTIQPVQDNGVQHVVEIGQMGTAFGILRISEKFEFKPVASNVQFTTVSGGCTAQVFTYSACRSGGTAGQGNSSSGNNHSQSGNSDSDSGSPSQSEVN